MIYYKNSKVTSKDNLLNQFSKKEFKSPYRSTIPLIVMFKSDQFSELGFIHKDNAHDIKYIFEYMTPVKKGKGSPSYTDLMIEYPNGCIAIEAKRCEPPYETVGKWVGKSNNRKLVLEGWFELINNHVKSEIGLKEVFDLPYQLIHRVASACSLKKQHTHIVYIGFDLDEKKTKYYLDCLRSLSAILNNQLDMYLLCYKIDKFEEQLKLEKKWDSGERDLSRSVINGLTLNSLMKLDQISKEKIPFNN